MLFNPNTCSGPGEGDDDNDNKHLQRGYYSEGTVLNCGGYISNLITN